MATKNASKPTAKKARTTTATRPAPQLAASADVAWPVTFRIPERFVADMPSVKGLDVADGGIIGRGVSVLYSAQPAGVAALLDHVQPRIPSGDYRYVLVKLARAGVLVEQRDGAHVVAGTTSRKRGA